MLFAIAPFYQALAHGELDEQIAAASEEISQAPQRAELYLVRADLHRRHRDWPAAEQDLDRVAELNPALAEVDWGRGLLFLESDRAALAVPALDRFIARQPGHAEALIVRARAHGRLKNWRPAADDFTRAIALLPEPRPEHYLERARALAVLGEEAMAEAVRGLDEGLARLGPVITLQLEAVELERRAGWYERALDRIDSISRQTGRKELWLVRRGELLREAGQEPAARKSFREALAALEQLPPGLRHTPATRELETRLRAALNPASPNSGQHSPPL